MKKLLALTAALLLGTGAFQSAAQEAVISHIEDLQWKVTWEEYSWVNPLNAIVDNPQYTAYLTDSKGTKTWLYYKQEVIFPEYGNFLTINLESLNLEDGDYELVIPEAYVLMGPGSVSNPEQYFDITIGEEPDADFQVVISNIESNGFDIYWENVTALAPGNTTGAYILNTSTQEKYDMLFLEGENYSKANIRISSSNLRVNITNNYPDLPDGTYLFYLPADYVTFNGTDKGNEAIDGYEFEYVAPWTEGPIAINGPSDSGFITVTWSDASKVEYNDEYAGDGFGTMGICIFDGKDIQVNVNRQTNLSFSGNVMTIDLNGLGLASGRCQLVVPPDCILVTVDGETGLTEGALYPFEYINPDEEEPEPEEPTIPEYQGEAQWSVEDGGEITPETAVIEVSWQGNELSPVEDPEDQVSVFGENEGYMELTFGKEVTLSDDNTKLRINLSELEPDTYRVNLPAGYVYIEVDGETFVNGYSSLENIIKSGEATSGLDGITSDNGIFNVFNLHGEKVLVTKKAAELRTLPKGIYIINGRKHIL